MNWFLLLVSSVFVQCIFAGQISLGVDYDSANAEWKDLNNHYVLAGGPFPEGTGYGWDDATFVSPFLNDALDGAFLCMINGVYFEVSTGTIEEIQPGHFLRLLVIILSQLIFVFIQISLIFL